MTIDHSNLHFVEVFRVLTILNSLPTIQEEQILSLQHFLLREEKSELREAVLSALQKKELSKALELLKGVVSLGSLSFVERRFSQNRSCLVEVSSTGDEEEVEIIDESKGESIEEEVSAETSSVKEISIEDSSVTVEAVEAVEAVPVEDAAVNQAESVQKDDDSQKEDVQSKEVSVKPEKVQESRPRFDDSLRKYLLRRFRKEQKDTHHKASVKQSRWEFWADQCGGRSLSDVEDGDVISRLDELGIKTFSDILLLPPRSYQRITLHPIEANMPVETVMIRAKIEQKYISIDPLMKRWVLVLSEKDGVQLHVRWVGNAPRGWDEWDLSTTIGLVGLVQLEDCLEMINAEPVGLAGRGSGILSNYGLEGVEDQEIRAILSKILSEVQGQIQDSLPKEIVDAAGLISLDDALREVHFPSNINYSGRKRMVFQEVFLYNVGKRLISTLEGEQGHRNIISHAGLARLSYEKRIILNDEQERVFSEIRRDLFSIKPMRRLLQGDVGAGKPMIALLSAISVLHNDVLVVYVCEDALSVERRSESTRSLLKMLSISTYSLSEAPSRAQFDALKKQGGLVFTTKEVLSSKLQSLNIRLVIMEENSGFGESFKNPVLRTKPVPDLLVLTPTPMPVAALETVYVDLNISLIPHTDIVFPKSTFLTSKYRAEAYASLLEQVKNGRQGYIVLPSKDGKDLLGVKETLQMAGALNAELLPGVRIGIYCSGMNTDERIKVFEDFQSRRIDVLLCSTIIEENPSVKNVSWMIVEMAERYTTLRLHRLRGFLATSHYQPTCQFILSDNSTEEDVERASLVCQEYSGFVLTEKLSSDEFPKIDYKWIRGDERDLRMLARELSRTLSLKDIRRVRWPLLHNAIVKRWGAEFDVPTKGRNYRKRRPRGKRN